MQTIDIQTHADTFGKRIRLYRHLRDLRAIDVANALDITPGYLSSLEHGKSKLPSVALLQRMGKLFGATVSQLLGETPLV